MTQQIILHKNEQKIDQVNLMASDIKNTLPTTKLKITGMDLMGLSWIFGNEVDSEIC